MDVDDTTPDTITYLADKFMAATGYAWVNPELGSNEPYKAFKREDTENVLVGTFLVRPIDNWFKTDGQKLQDLYNAVEEISSKRGWYLHGRTIVERLTEMVEEAGREGDTAVKEMKSIRCHDRVLSRHGDRGGHGG